MGYESRFYIVDKTDIKSQDGKRYWAQIIAMFDLCKVYAVSSPIRDKYPATDAYIYADDGNTEIIKDKYGDPLIEIPIDDMIQLMEKVITSEDYYRKYNPFLQLLKGFNKPDWGDLVVLHYGY